MTLPSKPSNRPHNKDSSAAVNVQTLSLATVTSATITSPNVTSATITSPNVTSATITSGALACMNTEHLPQPIATENQLVRDSLDITLPVSTLTEVPKGAELLKISDDMEIPSCSQWDTVEDIFAILQPTKLNIPPKPKKTITSSI